MATPVGALRVSLSASAAAFSRDMGAARRSVLKNSKGMKAALRDLQGAYTKAAKAAKIAAVAFAGGGAYAAFRGLKESVVIGARFEHQMLKVSGVMRATSEEMKDLTKVARQMGATTEFTATQSAEALQFLGMAGFGASKAIKALPGVLDLATASSIDLGRAADIASNALTAMQLPVEELSRVNDVFIGTTTRANVDMEQMAEAFKYAAPVAQAYGYSIEELSAYIGQLGNAGIQGSMAGTALAKSFQIVEKVFAAAGVNGEGKKLIDALELINAKGWGTSKIMQIFGDRAGKSALALLGLTKGTRDLTRELNSAEGESNRLADVIRSSLTNTFLTFKSTLEDVAIDTFNTYKEQLRETIEKGTEWVREHKEEFIETFGKIPPLLDKTGNKLENLYNIYNKFPKDVTGAAGAGIIGRILFGSVPIGKLIFALTYIYSKIDDVQALAQTASGSPTIAMEENARLLGMSVKEYQKHLENLKHTLFSAHGAFEELGGGMASSHEVGEKSIVTTDKQKESLNELEVAAIGASEGFEKLNRSKDERREEDIVSAVDIDLSNFFYELDNAKELPKELANEFDALTEAIDGWGKQSAQAFADFAMGGKTSFSDLINSMIADMIQMAAYEAIFKPLFGGLSSFVAPIFGGGKAAGGPVSAGEFYQVNEKGPELLTMGNKQFLMMNNQSGFVTPTGEGGPGGKTIVNQSFSIDARNADAGVEQRLRALVPQIIQQAKNATIDAARRGGATREVIGR